MRRGDIIRAVGRGDFSSKPRPSLIVQADLFNAHHPSLTVCPITSHVAGDALYRIPIARTAMNGLDRDSEIEIDRMQAIWLYRARGVIGHSSDMVMDAVDQALKLWLDL